MCLKYYLLKETKQRGEFFILPTEKYQKRKHFHARYGTKSPEKAFHLLKRILTHQLRLKRYNKACVRRTKPERMRAIDIVGYAVVFVQLLVSVAL